MKNTLILAFLMPFTLISCLSDDVEQVNPNLEKEKRIRFEFFTDKDYSSTHFENYFVNLNVGISLLEKESGLETKVVEETTGWISFKDIPKEYNNVLAEKLMQVDTHKYSVSYGYSHQVKIGDTIQMKAIGEFLKEWEDEKTVTIRF